MRQDIRFVLLLSCSLGSACWPPNAVSAHEGQGTHSHPVAVASSELYRPTAVPDRICVCLTETPATSVSVTWRTDATVGQAVAEYAIASEGPGFRENKLEVDAQTQPLRTDLGLAHYHEASFRELEPETKYLYRVGDGVNWSEWAEFETASADDAPFSFVYFGDAQNDIKSHWSRVVRNAFRDAPRAAFFLHAGDLVNRAESDAEWGEWFYSGGFIHRMLPAVAVPGNHEMAKTRRLGIPIGRRLSHHWRPTFAFPENGPELLPESCFYIDYQGVRLIALNSNQHQAEQAEWLDEVLAAAPGWKIVTHHHPIYSASAGRDNPELRRLWQPIYDRHHVDLVLQGHDHTYARSKPLSYGEGDPSAKLNSQPPLVGNSNVTEGAGVRSAGGTVYVVSVSGPKMYRLNRRPFMRSSAEDTQLYQVISIDGDTLEYRACTATGDTYDEFRLIRRDGKPNELVELSRESDAPAAAEVPVGGE